MSRNPISETATAYHEAGHALAHYVLGRGNGRVTIVPNKDCRGSARIGNTGKLRRLLRQLEFCDINARVIAKCHDEIVCLLAGRAAQRKFKPQSIRSYMARHDREMAADFLISLYPEEDERNAAVRYLTLRTRNLVGAPRHWRMIQDLAAALLETRTLTGGEVDAVLRASKRAYWAERDSHGRSEPSCSQREDKA